LLDGSDDGARTSFACEEIGVPVGKQSGRAGDKLIFLHTTSGIE